MFAEITGTGRRAGATAFIAALCVAWGLGGCGSGPPSRNSGFTPNGPSSAPASASPSQATYRIPESAGVCEAVRASGTALSEATPDKSSIYESGCKVELGSDPKNQSYTMRVKFSNEPTVGRAVATYDRKKDTDWNRQHSPFSGRASERKDVLGIGAAVVGREYDVGYYAYFPDVVVAQIPYGQSVVVLRRGNVLLEFDLLGGDRTGNRAIDMRPVAPEVAIRAFDDTADELLRLIVAA